MACNLQRDGMDGSVWDTPPPNHSFHSSPPLHHSKPQPSSALPLHLPPPLLPSGKLTRYLPEPTKPEDGGSDESSCRRFAGLGTGTASPRLRRFVRMAGSAELLPWRLLAAARGGAEAGAASASPGGGGDGGAAGDPVHPGHGRADDPGRAADQVAGRDQRRGHLQLRAAVGVRLVGGAGRHHRLLHDRRRGRAAVRRRERQVRQRQAGAHRGQVRHAHPQGVGQVHALHGEVLPGQRPPVRQEVIEHNCPFFRGLAGRIQRGQCRKEARRQVCRFHLLTDMEEQECKDLQPHFQLAE